MDLLNLAQAFLSYLASSTPQKKKREKSALERVSNRVTFPNYLAGTLSAFLTQLGAEEGILGPGAHSQGVAEPNVSPIESMPWPGVLAADYTITFSLISPGTFPLMWAWLGNKWTDTTVAFSPECASAVP